MQRFTNFGEWVQKAIQESGRKDHEVADYLQSKLGGTSWRSTLSKIVNQNRALNAEEYLYIAQFTGFRARRNTNDLIELIDERPTAIPNHMLEWAEEFAETHDILAKQAPELRALVMTQVVEFIIRNDLPVDTGEKDSAFLKSLFAIIEATGAKLKTT